MRAVLIASSLAAGLGACAAPGQGNVPPFIGRHLNAPHAQRVKVYADQTGRITKWAVHVDREAVPDFVFMVADRELGHGADVDIEVEQYADGDQVYEITRERDGKMVEVSVRLDQTVRYTEEEVDDDSVPQPVREAVAAVAGFEVRRYLVKREASGETWFAKGVIEGGEVDLLYDAGGNRLSRRRHLETVFVISSP